MQGLKVMGSTWIDFLISDQSGIGGGVGGTESVRVSVVSATLASYDYYLVVKSLAAFAMFRGCYQESP